MIDAHDQSAEARARKRVIREMRALGVACERYGEGHGFKRPKETAVLAALDAYADAVRAGVTPTIPAEAVVHPRLLPGSDALMVRPDPARGVYVARVMALIGDRDVDVLLVCADAVTVAPPATEEGT